MRIAQVISNLSYGGAERQLGMLCEGLAARGHEVAVATMRAGGELVPGFRDRPWGAVEIGMRGPIDPGAFARLRAWLRETRPDLVHAHLFKAEVYGLAAARGLDLPVVCTKHNEDAYLRHPAVAALARQAAHRAAALVAVSGGVRAHFHRAVGDPSIPVVLIPIGIPLPRSGRGPATRPPAGAIGPRFGVVARLVEQKGHDVLLRAISLAGGPAARATLDVFGTGPEERRLRALATSLGIADRVHFRGLVLDPDAIGGFEVAVLPSRWEGAGLSLLESMARGLPVVASRVGGIPETVGEAALLVPPADPAALARALERIAGDAALRHLLAAAGPARAARFDFERTLDRHLALYERVLADHRIG